MIEILAAIAYAAVVLAQFVDAVTTAVLMHRNAALELNPVARFFARKVGLLRYLVGKGALFALAGAALLTLASPGRTLFVFGALLAWHAWWLLRYNVPAYREAIRRAQ